MWLSRGLPRSPEPSNLLGFTSTNRAVEPLCARGFPVFPPIHLKLHLSRPPTNLPTPCLADLLPSHPTAQTHPHHLNRYFGSPKLKCASVVNKVSVSTVMSNTVRVTAAASPMSSCFWRMTTCLMLTRTRMTLFPHPRPWSNNRNIP